MTNHEPKNLKRWTMPDSYLGETWPNYYSAGVGQSRDSDALERSNFECTLKSLGGESETVVVVRESHWAVGWIEWIAIHQDDETALRIADDIVAALSDYPVLSDDHFSELEMADAEQAWANNYSPAERIEYIRRFPSQFEFCSLSDMLGCVRGKHFAGNASELFS
jgi:hypothetical protein